MVDVEKILSDTGALQTGHFILTSGKHSGHYMQCAKITQYPDYTGQLCGMLADGFKGVSVDAVIGPATGGIIVAYELARQLNVKSLFAERENGEMVLRRGFGINKGSKVIVAEDVITTGGSVKEVIGLVSGMGAEVVGVAVFVDRSMGKADFGVKLVSCYKIDVLAYEPENCPLCKEGSLPAGKPGSRGLQKN
ncbi:MAG: orotate phosphoribosyltransferase [Clostridiales bacterium]|jgi:orotate phosphoribosyltransferase|nr:orotate phosphoribosyltransferase [Clostridiales bacterium]